MKTKAVQISAAGASVIIPAVAGTEIRVYAFSLSAVPVDDTVPVFSVVKFQSLNPTTGVAMDLTGNRALTQNGLSWDMMMTPFRMQRPDAYFVTNAGEGLALTQEAAFDLGGFVCYEQILI